jgi:hypothetical protein
MKIIELWQKQFGEFKPLGFLLKVEFFNRWLRIHNLPMSKQYPQDDSEYEEVYKRNIRIIEDNLNLKEIYIFCTCYQTNQSTVYQNSNIKSLENINLELYLSDDITDYDFPDEPYFRNIYFTKFSWNIKKIKEILKDLNDEKLSHLALYSSTTNVVICPYPGGVDIIYNDAKDVLIGEKKYKSWLPNKIK